MKFENFFISEIKPNIFFFKFKDSWKLALFFFRYQEEYESELFKVRNKSLTFIELLEIYSKKYGDGKFTYCNDYAGFNIPSYIVKNVFENQYNDFNKNDHEMIKAYKYCREVCNNKDFYIIGAVTDSYMRHEIAHGLFYTNQQYKSDMLKLICEIDKESVKKFYNVLKKERYHKSVFNDEMQAYLSTGLLQSMRGIIDKKSEKKFVKLFKKYYAT